MAGPNLSPWLHCASNGEIVLERLLKPPRQARSPRCSADLRQVLSFDCAPPSGSGGVQLTQTPQ
ncbi:hypothetical protein BIW11_11271, partial [Tropilaelaps mercedesae]